MIDYAAVVLPWWLSAAFVFLWGQRDLKAYLAVARPDILDRRQELVRDPGLLSAFTGIGLSLSAHRALLQRNPDPALDLLRRRAAISAVCWVAYPLPGLFLVAGAISTLGGLVDLVTGQPFYHWDGVFLLIYMVAILLGVWDYYQRAGFVSGAWWRGRLVGAAGGLVFLIAYAAGWP